MPRSPLIAVTASIRPVDGAPRVRLNAAYVTAVERSGAIPLVVPPLVNATDAWHIVDTVDALLLTGGEDVEPARYGEQPHPTVGEVNAARDATEVALVTAARERRLPTLAICRGIQLLNVAFGGSLVQDIPSQRPDAANHDPESARGDAVHDVSLEPGSRLAAIAGATALRVNSFHHQAVDRVAEGFRVTAWSPDGVIEGMEWGADDWWAVAVQWHPEELTRGGGGIFEAVAREASRAERAPR